MSSECDVDDDALISAAAGAAVWSAWTEWTPLVAFTAYEMSQLAEEPLTYLEHGASSGAWNGEASFAEVEIELRIIGARPLRIIWENNLGVEQETDLVPANLYHQLLSGVSPSRVAVCIVPL